MKIKLTLAFVFLILNKAYSQIVYTSITPNFEINMSPPGSIDNIFPIDFNNDGVVDFRFRWDAASSLDYFLHLTNGYAGVYYPNNHVIGNTLDSFGYVTPLGYGAPIDVSSEWYTITGPSISNGFNGNFFGLGDKYIGVRFFANNQHYYGWILVSFITNKLIIKSYAYQTNPSLGIFAGQVGGSLGVGNHNVAGSIQLYPNPATDGLKISGLKRDTNYRIYNIEGRMIKTGSVNAKNEISISELIKGDYVISLEDNGSQYNMRFIKK